MTDQPQPQQPNVPPQPELTSRRQQPQTYGAPQQPMSQQDEKTWATLVHLAPFLAAAPWASRSSAR